MALIDYVELAATVQNILDDGVGRAISLVKLDRTTVDDATKPWRGSADPRDNGAPESATVIANVQAAFVSLGGFGFDLEGANDETKRPYQTCFVAANDVVGNDLTTFDELWDADGSTWRIKKCHVLKPSSTLLLYGLELES